MMYYFFYISNRVILFPYGKQNMVLRSQCRFHLDFELHHRKMGTQRHMALRNRCQSHLDFVVHHGKLENKHGTNLVLRFGLVTGIWTTMNHLYQNTIYLADILLISSTLFLRRCWACSWPMFGCLPARSQTFH